MKIKCYVLEIRQNNCQRRKTHWYQIPRHLNLDHFVSIFNFWRENFFTSVHFSLWQRWSLVHSWMQYCTARLVSQHFDLLLFSASETYNWDKDFERYHRLGSDWSKTDTFRRIRSFIDCLLLICCKKLQKSCWPVKYWFEEQGNSEGPEGFSTDSKWL